MIARTVLAVGGGLVVLLGSPHAARAQSNPACTPVVTSDQTGQSGTTPPRAFDRNMGTLFQTGYTSWQYLQVDFSCVGDFSGVRRYMSKSGSVAGKRVSQGEALAYSVNGVTWTNVSRIDTTGWEPYVGYAATAWHSVPYGWSAWLRLKKPVKARFVRFRWDGDLDALNEVEAFFHEPPPPDPLMEGLSDLREESTVPPRVRFDHGIPRYVAARVPVPAGLPDDPVVQALDFLKRNKGLYRLQDPLAQLYLRRVAGRDDKHVFFGQHRNGVRVHGARLAVHLSGGAVVATTGFYVPALPELPTPSLSGADAVGKATFHLQQKKVGQIKVIGPPELAYFNDGLLSGLSDPASGTRYAYRLALEGRYGSGEPQSWSYIMDAQTGAILRSRINAAGDPPDKDFDIESGLGTSSDQENWFDASGSTSDYQGGINDPDLEGLAAWRFTHNIYDYYFSRFHRHSYDDGEDQVEVTVDLVFGPSVAQYAAYYNPQSEVIYVSAGQLSRNLLAHEFTHGVIEHSADFEYENASGALNEAFANIFGALIDQDFSPLQAAASACSVTAGTPGGPPNISGAPGHMGQICGWVGNPECDQSDQNWNDCGFVHENDWIIKRAGNLIINGGTWNGVTVASVGAPRAETLFYEVLTGWLEDNSNFQDMRDITVDRARDRNDFSDTDVCAVINAFGAVGLGDVDLNCDGVYDGSGQDLDADQLIDAVDNCPSAANPGQENRDGDSQGDACDADDDNDGVVDGLDNCPLDNNPGQDNFDHDARGDVCDDDDDLDGRPDMFDNCPFANNPGQQNFDGDAQGDRCDPDDDNDGFLDASDNCDFLINDQANSDGDAWGNACDNCPNVSTTNQFDRDDDGLGDACDGDRDGDTILNADDNCPDTPNEDQLDTDKDGEGIACDPVEQRWVYGSTDGEYIMSLIRFLKLDRPIRIPIGPCIEDCPDWFGEDYFTEVQLDLPFATDVRVVDDRGDLAARRDPADKGKLRFRVDGDYRYQPPNEALGGDAPLYEGRRYFLEILPTKGLVAGREYEMGIRVRSGREEHAH